MKLTLPHLHSSNVIITQNLHRKVYDRNHLFREYVSCSFFDFFYILLNRINFAYIIFHRGNVQTVISSSSRWIKPYKNLTNSNISATQNVLTHAQIWRWREWKYQQPAVVILRRKYYRYYFAVIRCWTRNTTYIQKNL